MELLVLECVCVSLQQVAGGQVGHWLEHRPGRHAYHPPYHHPQQGLPVLVECWPEDGVGGRHGHTLDYSNLEVEPVTQLGAQVGAKHYSRLSPSWGPLVRARVEPDGQDGQGDRDGGGQGGGQQEVVTVVD